MDNTIKKVSFGALLLVGLYSLSCLAPTSLSAQQGPSPQGVDQATREVDHQLREEAEERLAPRVTTPSIEEEEEPAPSSRGPKLLIKEIKLEGTDSFPAEDFSPILKKYTDREISIDDLKIISSAIEREYLRRGLIAGCFAPPQDIEDGIVTLRVVEAKFGTLKINQHGRFFDPERIRYYWTLKPGDVLRYDKMSKDSQMMNKNPDRTVSLTLHAGEKPGTTDVLMDVKTRFPVHIFGSFDREGAVTTGRIRTGLGVRHNNFLMVDDTFMFGSSFGKDFSSIYMYHVVPITPFGTSVMYGYSDSRSAPKKEYERYVIKSETQNYSVYVKQDVYKKDEYMGEVSLGLDANDKTSRSLAGTGTLSRDRLRLLRMKSTLIHRFPGAITSITPELSQGFNWLGARRKNSFSSRQTTNTFTKFNFNIRHRRALPMDLQATFNLKSQWAGEKLPSQEQLGIGGIDSVRGYPSQDYMADDGVVTNFELIFPSFWIPKGWKIPYDTLTLREDISLFTFFDWAWGKKRGDIQGEKHLDYLSGAGIGMRIKMFNQASLQLALGFPLPFADKPLTETADSRFHISLNFEDQFHEEFLKIKDTAEKERMDRLAARLIDKELNNTESPLRKRIYGTFLMAEEAAEAGKLIDASSLYADVIKMCKDVKAQALRYVSDLFSKEKELLELSKKAEDLFFSGNLIEARSLWQDISSQTDLPVLMLDI